jgi:hypothetical protein
VKVSSLASVMGVGSTTTSLVLATGHGAHYLKNQAVLIPCPTATTGATVAGSTTSVLHMNSGDEAKFSVGDIIGVATQATERGVSRVTAIDTTNHYLTVSPALPHAPAAAATVTKVTLTAARITAINTDTLTVSPALPAAPVQYDPIRAGIHYMLSTNELPSYFVDYWRGDQRKEAYAGGKIDSLEMDLTVGQKVTAKFTGMSLGMTMTSGASCPLSASFNNAQPNIAQSQVVILDGATVNCDKFTFKLANTIYDRKDITSAGISKRLQMSRTITGSFSCIYDSDTLFNNFTSDTRSEAILTVGRLGFIDGNAIIITIPKLKYTDVPMSLDTEIYKYDVTFGGDPTNGEDSIGAISFF